jgi:hypothetical protein
MIPRDFKIDPADLRDFAKADGWVLVPEAMRDRLFLLNHPKFAPRQLSFPMDTTAPDYSEAISRTLERLADMKSMSPELLAVRVAAYREDVVHFRIVGEQQDTSLPLPFAAHIVAAAEQALRAAACSVVKPQRHHKRLTRNEAKEVAESARFQHTRPGSFVLPVSCPINAVDAHPALLPGEQDAPFMRRTTNMLERGLLTLIQGVEQDTLDKLVSNDAEPSVVSSNLCDAVVQFYDPVSRNSLEVEIDWAPSLPQNKTRRPLRIQRDYFARIAEVGDALAKVESQEPDTFIGTVEQLAGELGDDGRRAGDVILALLLPEGEVVRSRVQLDADNYVLAGEAHMTNGRYVKVVGKLQPGRQPRVLRDMSCFEPLWPRSVDTESRRK